MRRAAVAAALVAIALVGGGLRFYATWGGARDSGDYVLGHDSDPYYHFRRLEYLRQNGTPLVEDAFAAAPARFACVWPVAFEYLALGLDAAVFHGERDRESLLLAAGFLPLLIGLLTLFALYFALREPRGGPRALEVSTGAALGGVAIAAVLPAALHGSRFADFDHHCLELLVFVALPSLATVAMRLRAAAAAAIGALACGLAVLAVDGAYLAFGALAAALVAFAWTTRARPPSAETRSLAFFFAGAFWGILGSSAVELAKGWPRLLPQLGRAGIATVLVGLALVVAWRGRARLIGVAVALAGAALATGGVVKGAGFLAARDAISPHIAEAQPLWARAPAPYFAAHAALLVVAIAQAWRRRREPAHFFLAAAATAGGAIGLLQTKYVFLFGLTAPWAIATSIEMLAARRAWRAVAAIALVLFCGWRVRAEMVHSPSAVAPADLAFAEVAKKLASPELAAPFARDDSLVPGAKPDFTVVVDPSLGPRALYLGRRAVTSVPFWGTPALTAQFQDSLRALLATDENDAERRLDALHARFLLVDDLEPARVSAHAAAGLSDLHLERELWRRLLDANGSALPSGAPAWPRFRLIAAAGVDDGRIKLFERVAGARLDGAEPGAHVTLRVRTPDGAEFFWAADAAPDGALRVPYATEPSPRAAFALSARRLCPSGERDFAISEAAVVTGGAIALPPCP